MVMQTLEYKQFGPWVLPVTTASDVPRIFQDYDFRPAESLLALKIPRQIERRNARPDMDLYDFFIDLRPEGLVILVREGARYYPRWTPFSDILAVTDSIALLHGELTVYTTTGVETIPYSGVSRELMTQLATCIRARSAQRAPQFLGKFTTPTDMLGMEHIFVSLHRQFIARNPNAQLLCSQPLQQVVAQRPTGFLTRADRAQWVSGSLAYVNGHELEIMHRENVIARTLRTDHSIASTAIPLAQITSITAERSSVFRGILDLWIELGAGHRFSFPVSEDRGQWKNCVELGHLLSH